MKYNIEGSRLFPSHSKITRILDRIGFFKLKSWFKTRAAKKKYLVSQKYAEGLIETAIPSVMGPSTSYEKKEWWQIEQGLRFNPNLEAKLLHAKSDEEARLIARVHWTSGRGPEAPPQGSGWVS